MKNRRMKAARALAGMTQTELGALVDMDKATISRIESGLRPRPEQQQAIAAALGATVTELWPLSSETHARSEIIVEGP